MVLYKGVGFILTLGDILTRNLLCQALQINVPNVQFLSLRYPGYFLGDTHAAFSNIEGDTSYANGSVKRENSKRENH